MERLGEGLAGLTAAGVATLVSSAWWVVAVDLMPAASRPYIGGSDTNSAATSSAVSLTTGLPHVRQYVRPTRANSSRM